MKYISLTSSTKTKSHSNKPSAMRLILSSISRNMPNTLSSSQAMDSHSGFSEEDFVIKQSICSGSRILLYLPRVFVTMS